MKRLAVIGLGNFGGQVTRALSEEGGEVIAVDRSQEKVQAVAEAATSAIVLDATDAEQLKALGLEEVDAVVVSTGARISTSILICYHLKNLGVRQIIVKAEDDDHGRILTQLGATRIIRPDRDMAFRLARRLSHPNVLDFLPLEQDYSLVEIDPPPALVGKTLAELELRRKLGVYVIAVRQAASEKLLIVPPADYAVQKDDVLMVLGKESDVGRIREIA